MSRRPLGKHERNNCEWAKHLKPYGKRRVNKGQRLDAKDGVRLLTQGREARAYQHMAL